MWEPVPRRGPAARFRGPAPGLPAEQLVRAHRGDVAVGEELDAADAPLRAWRCGRCRESIGARDGRVEQRAAPAFEPGEWADVG